MRKGGRVHKNTKKNQPKSGTGNGTDSLEDANSLAQRIHYGRHHLGWQACHYPLRGICAPVRKQGSFSLGGTSLPMKQRSKCQHERRTPQPLTGTGAVIIPAPGEAAWSKPGAGSFLTCKRGVCDRPISWLRSRCQCHRWSMRPC